MSMVGRHRSLKSATMAADVQLCNHGMALLDFVAHVLGHRSLGYRALDALPLSASSLRCGACIVRHRARTRIKSLPWAGHLERLELKRCSADSGAKNIGFTNGATTAMGVCDGAGPEEASGGALVVTRGLLETLLSEPTRFQRTPPYVLRVCFGLVCGVVGFSGRPLPNPTFPIGGSSPSEPWGVQGARPQT